MPVAVTRRRFTADDYQRMGQAGILRREDRVELIDGEIVTTTPIGPRHCASVDRATRAFVMKAGDSAVVRVQGSVRLDFYTEPEPDLVLLRPRPYSVPEGGTYRNTRRYTRSQSLAPHLLPECVVSTADLLSE
jgi:hypothetical protein